jgi:hypothetical protein
MTRPAWAPHLAAVLGYVLLAVAFSWPLLPHLSTHLTGDPGGDTGVYVWNQWVFRNSAIVEHRNPLTTEHIFSLTGRPVDLSQHNYTLFADLLALPLGPRLGTVATFNVVYLATVVLTAWMGFVLARRVIGGHAWEAWLAGMAFAWSPVLVARSTGHFSLVAAAPLAAFVWSLHRVERSERLRDSLLAGLSVAWAASCDVYYAVFCLGLATIYVTSRLLRVDWRPGWWRGPRVWMLDLCIVLAGGLVVGLAFGRGGRFNLLGLPVSIRGLYGPVLLLTLLVAARVLVYLRPRVDIGWPQPRSLRLTAAAALFGALLLSPTLFGAAQRVLEGSWVSPPTYWRSSPAGVDLLALLAPNPAHPWVRAVAGDAQSAAPTHYVEYTAALGLVPLAVIALAAWRAGLRSRGWFWTLGIYFCLALGPFVHIAGVNTYVPGPWAVLRYVPIIGLTRMPGRFAVVAALAVSVLFAMGLRAMAERWPARRRLLLATVGLLLAFELLPAPRPLYSAAVPSIYDVVRADPRPVRILELPFGVRDGVSTEGDFSARYQFHQTVHGKPLMGGYLSRVSERRFREVRTSGMLGMLLTLSDGRTPTPAARAAQIARAPQFVVRANLGWVVIHPSRTPPALEAFVREAFALERVAADGDAVLYRPRTHFVPAAPAAR